MPTKCAKLLGNPLLQIVLAIIASLYLIAVGWRALFCAIWFWVLDGSVGAHVIVGGLGFGGLSGIAATFLRLYVSNVRFQRSRLLYWLTLCGLIFALLTALPLSAFSFTLVSWAPYSGYARYSYWPLWIGLMTLPMHVFLLLALIGARKLQQPCAHQCDV